MDSIRNDCIRAYPDIIINCNPFGSDALFNKWPPRVVEDMVDRDDLKSLAKYRLDLR